MYNIFIYIYILSDSLLFCQTRKSVWSYLLNDRYSVTTQGSGVLSVENVY